LTLRTAKGQLAREEKRCNKNAKKNKKIKNKNKKGGLAENLK
jgi:hypothetical protein